MGAPFFHRRQAIAHGRRTPRLARPAGVLALLAAGVLIALGCTVTKRNYAMLSTFFDGVPDPNARALAVQGDATLAAAVIVHKPFAEEKCESCHKTQYRPKRNDPTPCLSCHEKAGKEHAWVHGAVAGGACLWCHSPHESARKWLLRGPDRKVCGQCHAATMTDRTVPAHSDDKMSCVACHYGHGGENSLMLRPGASATSPPAEGADGASGLANSPAAPSPTPAESAPPESTPAEAAPPTPPEAAAGPPATPSEPTSTPTDTKPEAPN